MMMIVQVDGHDNNSDGGDGRLAQLSLQNEKFCNIKSVPLFYLVQTAEGKKKNRKIICIVHFFT